MKFAELVGDPDVSVVMPIYESEGTLRSCLEALTLQSYATFEVIVVDGSPDPQPARQICDDFPHVRYMKADSRLGAHAKRNLGAAAARGQVLSFTDPDCTADPEWLEHLVRAHQRGHPVVGGAVAGLADPRNERIHLNKYAWWLPGSAAGPRSEIPSANTSLTKEVWQIWGPYREDRWASDSELSWRLRKAGIRIWFEPNAVVTHLDHGPWRAFLRNRYERGFDFGLTRAEFREWGRFEQILRAALFPSIPFVMTARAAAFSRRAGQLPTWFRTIPAQLMAHLWWAAGEARALIAGSS
jgi:GT2 family glycosyltransferase